MRDLDLPGREALALLLSQLARSPGARTSVLPGRAVVERSDGAHALEVDWSPAQHAAALQLFETPAAIDAWVATRAGDALVFTLPPQRGLEALIAEGCISELAARLLDACVGAGRNVLIAGPWAAGVELAAALLAGGARSGVLAPAVVATPHGWARLGDGRDAAALGADRLGVWLGAGPELAELMATGSGVVGWLDAGRLEQALMRFEAGLERAAQRPQTPLAVLAGVDLVVVMARGGAPRVRDVAEITMAPDGYRPSLLFTSGLAPAPLALVPVAAPTFLDELALAGHHVLADELRAVSASRRVARAEERARVLAEERPRAQSIMVPAEEQRAPRVTLERPLVERAAPPAPELPRELVEALRHAPPPGWELDQAGAEGLAEQDGGPATAEEATMAATFGLAPPPRPPGVKADASFAEALRRARERDEGGRGGGGDA